MCWICLFCFGFFFSAKCVHCDFWIIVLCYYIHISDFGSFCCTLQPRFCTNWAPGRACEELLGDGAKDIWQHFLFSLGLENKVQSWIKKHPRCEYSLPAGFLWLVAVTRRAAVSPSVCFTRFNKGPHPPCFFTPECACSPPARSSGNSFLIAGWTPVE